ncbi:MAG TPA: DUF4395 domain-containing protein [Ktedonobacterales bacterium]|nr:DUF4395 domain-containing protein [Ktedonobacterales bacterium]
MEQSASVGIPHIDVRLLKFSQACTVLLTALAFITQQSWVVLVAAAALALSAAIPAAGPLRLLYRGVLVPLHLLAPRIAEDDPAPHRFAQAVGAIFLTASSIILFGTQATALGWVFDLIVFALALLNFSVGFCAGCFVYYHLGRLGMLPRVRYSGGFHWRGV